MSDMTDEQISEAFPGQDVAHVRAMMDKMSSKGATVHPNADGGDNGTAPAEPATVQYPEWMPEKFRQGSVDEAMQKLAQSYTVLEGARGNPANPAGSGDGGTPPGDDGAPAQPPTRVDLRAVESEFVSNGSLSEATYAMAEAQGLSRADLDTFISGQKALADAFVSRVHSMAGGEQQYSTLLAWAEKNWSPAEVDAFDSVMTSGDEGQVGMAVRALKAAYTEANGSRPNLLTGNGDQPGQGDGFQSKAEMTAAMKDPRYKKDPAYRAEVERKIANGNVW